MVDGYVSKLETTWRDAVVQFKDDLASVSNLTVVKDTFGSTPADVSDGDEVIYEVANRAADGGFRLNGEHLDFTNGLWDSGAGSYTESSNEDVEMFELTLDDMVQVWYNYGPQGGCIYVRRIEGDGNDEAGSGGLVVMETAFDTTTLSTDPANNDIDVISLGRGTMTTSETDPKGIRNPDTAMSNYVFKPGYGSAEIEDGDTQQKMLIGTCNYWVRERSGSSVNNEDVVQVDGTSTYELLSYHNENIGLRMN